jgi:uncharacterized protein
MLIIGFYAGALALLYLVLTFRTIFLRGKLRVALGDGKQESLQRAIRAHANFAEYVPLALILLVLIASNSSPTLLIHGLGLALLLGRLLHALGVSRTPEPLVLRQAGMVLTIGCILVSAVYLLVKFISLTLANM